MEYEQRKKVYLEAQERWGDDSQILVAIEEFGELITVLAKRNRNLNGSTEDEICSEIADARVMLEHLELIFDKEKINEHLCDKVARLQSWFEKVDRMIE